MTAACRFCGEALRLTFVDLGETPLANAYLTQEQLGRPEPRYPLHVRVCGACRLVQADSVATPEEIFAHYAYFSSYATSWVEHARRFAAAACGRFGLGPGSQVVEVASNDGYLLRHFIAAGVPCLGVEPAANVAEVAKAAGVPTEVRFFGRETARDLAGRGFAADLLVGNNVLAHVPDLNDFVAGLAYLLKPDGVLSVEFPHLLRLIQEVQFDTIYHEHFCYFSLLAVERVFAAYGLKVFDIDELPTHGGSLRVLACRASSAAHGQGPGLARVRAAEAAAGLDGDAAYAGFPAKVSAARDSLRAFLAGAKAEGRTVAAFGAAAKGNTLLNYCRVGPDDVLLVADSSPHKQGRYLPGSHLPVVSPERLIEARPDYVVILPWNLAAEITAQMAAVRSWGGRFAVPIPTTRLLP